MNEKTKRREAAMRILEAIGTTTIKSATTMNEKFEWVQRYGENDKFNRWGLVCYFNGMLIAWITETPLVSDTRYCVNDYFPSVHLANPLFSGLYKDLDTAKAGVEIRFREFIQIINQ